MAQADEMGDGEGRDDGFVDCGEAVRKRNRKKQGEYVRDRGCILLQVTAIY